MLIDSASSATLDQDMFWHGLSLVSSRLKGGFIQSMVFQRERNIGQFECVLGDDRHHRSMDCSFHWKSNTCLCFDQAVDSLRAKPRGFNVNLRRGNLILFGTVDFFFFFFRSHSLHDASSRSRRSCCCRVVLVRWFQERCLLAAR